jgi:hypothetical protein
MSVLDEPREDDYLREVDDLLLGLSWRRRRRVIADLRRRIRTNDRGRGPLESTADSFVSEVLGTESRSRLPLRFRPLVSWVWPSPREWIAAGLRGVAMVIGVIFAYGVIQNLAERLMWTGTSYADVWAAVRDPLNDRSVRTILSPHEGLLALTLVCGWFVGQILNGSRLARDARARRHQGAATVVAVCWLVGAAVWAAVLITW